MKPPVREADQWKGLGNREVSQASLERSPLKLRPEEITSILKRRIEEYDVETDLAEVGSVLEVGDGIARVYGLENAVSLEMLEFEHGVTGLALNLEEDNVGTALFGEWEHVKEGEVVKRTGRVTSIPVGEALIGRIVNPLGQPLDGRGQLDVEDSFCLGHQPVELARDLFDLAGTVLLREQEQEVTDESLVPTQQLLECRGLDGLVELRVPQELAQLGDLALRLDEVAQLLAHGVEPVFLLRGLVKGAGVRALGRRH